MVIILSLYPSLTYTNPKPNLNPNKNPNLNPNPNTNLIPTHRCFGIDFCCIYCVLAFRNNARQNRPIFNRPQGGIFEVQIAIQQTVPKVGMSGAYIREVYTYYCTSGSRPKKKKNPDPGVTAEMDVVPCGSERQYTIKLFVGRESLTC